MAKASPYELKKIEWDVQKTFICAFTILYKNEINT